MSVALYFRVSTEEQRDRQSIATQRDFGQRFCELHQLPIADVYADDGVSGTIPFEARPAGKRLLADARQGKFQQLLVFKLDRLGRETRLILNYVADLEKCNVRVRSMTEEFDTATPSGRLMLTMLSGFAAHERDVIRERSILGTNRLAEAGAWLGGIVPYGYKKVGERAEARLMLNEDPIPGFTVSEADIVRKIFHMSAEEGKSCQKIADHLASARYPCTSSQKSDLGKRARRTASFWRVSHIRNMIVNPTYMGEHSFGRRSKHRNRPLIKRPVVAIVSADQFQRAQQALKSNRIISGRTGQPPYLLKSKIKCALCGLTYTGMRAKGQRDFYYRCSGRQFARNLYGTNGKKCTAKSLNGDYVESLVWADIQAFLRDPKDVLATLQSRLASQEDGRENSLKRLEQLKLQLKSKAEEKERVLSLFRRGRIDDATLDHQLDVIEVETAALSKEIGDVQHILSIDHAEEFKSVESVVAALRKTVENGISMEMKQRIIGVLVDNIQANTVERWGVQQSEIVITYRFSQPNGLAPVNLSKVHRAKSRSRPVEHLNTIGDHLRRKRQEIKVLQQDVAKQLGVTKSSVFNWESNRSQPAIHQMPAIIAFLGYDPLPSSSEWGGKLKQTRIGLGVSQKEWARRMDVDPSTLARWERGEREPTGELLKRVINFLAS